MKTTFDCRPSRSSSHSGILVAGILLAASLMGCDTTGSYEQRIDDAAMKVGQTDSAPAAPAPAAPAGENQAPAEGAPAENAEQPPADAAAPAEPAAPPAN